MKLFTREELESSEVYIAELQEIKVAEETATAGVEFARRWSGTGEYVAVTVNEEGQYVDLENGKIYSGQTFKSPWPERIITDTVKYAKAYQEETGKKAKPMISKKSAIKLAKHIAAQKKLEKEEGATV